VRTACLYGAMEALRERGGSSEVPPARRAFDQSAAEVRTALGETAFVAAWAEGRAMSTEQAVAYALRQEDGPAQHDRV
jgi:hypothetical protein